MRMKQQPNSLPNDAIKTLALSISYRVIRSCCWQFRSFWPFRAKGNRLPHLDWVIPKWIYPLEAKWKVLNPKKMKLLRANPPWTKLQWSWSQSKCVFDSLKNKNCKLEVHIIKIEFLSNSKIIEIYQAWGRGVPRTESILLQNLQEVCQIVKRIEKSISILIWMRNVMWMYL